MKPQMIALLTEILDEGDIERLWFEAITLVTMCADEKLKHEYDPDGTWTVN